MRIAVRIRLACVAALLVLGAIGWRMPRAGLPARVTPALRTLRTHKAKPYELPATPMAKLVREVRKMRAAHAAQVARSAAARRAVRPNALAHAQPRTGSAVLGAPAAAPQAGQLRPKPVTPLKARATSTGQPEPKLKGKSGARRPVAPVAAGRS